jgi:hypothetical protein
MRVLTIFVDMIRANRLSTFNDDIRIDTPLDIAFKELGGTVYNNCFTPGPDTPRGMSTYYTGINPYKNGCNARLKWPQYFLNENLNTIFDLFLEQKYEINCFSSPRERETGLFPEHIYNMNIHNQDYDMDKYLSNIKLKDKHFLFVSVPDYHRAFDDFGYSTKGESKAYDVTKSVWDSVFKSLNKDDFDHIFIFSDHGFKFAVESRLEPKMFMLNEDRANNIMIHRAKGDNNLVKNNKLCSIADLYTTYQDILDIEQTKSISLLSKKEHEFIVLEDHFNFSPELNQNIELWALVSKDFIYIRKLDIAIKMDRKTRNLDNKVIIKYDNYLKNNSSFGKYLNEYEKIFKYKLSILPGGVYMNGVIRKKSSIVGKYVDFFIDLIKYKKTEG